MHGDAVAAHTGDAPLPHSAGPVYYDHPYRTSGDSAVTRAGMDDRGPYVVLESPLFYPQGGGQKGDRGTLSGAGLIDAVAVLDTRRVDGEIRHYLAVPLPDPAAAGTVRQDLDWPFRHHQMKMHSAAHFLHCELERVIGAELPYPVRAPLSETGGESHYEFTDLFTPAQLAGAVIAMNAYMAQGHAITTRADEGRGPGMRTWHCGDYMIACGGLHPHSSAEIGEIAAGMRTKRGKTLVSFGPRPDHG
jgi:Ser-tRNA(Ala) deacylase AlaX